MLLPRSPPYPRVVCKMHKSPMFRPRSRPGKRPRATLELIYVTLQHFENITPSCLAFVFMQLAHFQEMTLP